MIRIECPIAPCGFEHLPRRTLTRGGGHEHVLPDGTVLAGAAAAERHDRVGAHLRRHTVRDWAEEVLRLRRIVTDPDNHVAVAREAQQLALAEIRRLKDERDAALAEVSRLRRRLAERTTAGNPTKTTRLNPTANCPVCERNFLLRQDGRIRLHNQPGKSQACPGSHALVADSAPTAA